MNSTGLALVYFCITLHYTTIKTKSQLYFSLHNKHVLRGPKVSVTKILSLIITYHLRGQDYVVKNCTEQKSKKNYTVKMIDMTQYDGDHKKRGQLEIQIMNLCKNHANICWSNCLFHFVPAICFILYLLLYFILL